MENISLYNKISALPDSMKSEVNDFIDFLVLRAQKNNKRARPKFGSGKGMFTMAPDFDHPLEDFKQYVQKF